MKKLLLSAAVLLSMTASTFAIGNRVIELKSVTNLEASNNLFGVTDFLVPEVVIDLSDLKNQVPNSGFNVSTNMSELFSLNIDVPHGPKIGFGAGVEMYGSASISKSFFKLIYEGHDFTENEELTCSVDDTYADVFAYTNATFGMDIGNRITFKATPTLFSTVAHVGLEDTKVTLTNTNEGKFGISMTGRIATYAGSELPSFQEYTSLLNSLNNNCGFDFSAEGYYKLFDFLDVGGSFRIPMVPSRPKVETSQSFEYSLITDIEELTGNTFTLPAFVMGEPVYTNGNYVLNRPMKFAATAIFHPIIDVMPWADLITCTGTVGLGVKHSFTPDAKVYFDYSLSTKLSLFNMLKLTVATEHMDEIFKNKVELGMNVRLLEIDAGVSVASKSFTKSFTGGGVGAYLVVCMGF
ncbi:MAG: hypothetical protein MJ162_07705 [Treponema sp.]|nr:hypothetical protein [Treponema sp.]